MIGADVTESSVLVASKRKHHLFELVQTAGHLYLQKIHQVTNRDFWISALIVALTKIPPLVETCQKGSVCAQ